MIPETTVTPPAPVLIGVADVCCRYGMSRSHVYRLLGEGRIAAVKLGRRILITATSLDAYIASLPAADILPDRRSRRRAAATTEART